MKKATLIIAILFSSFAAFATIGPISGDTTICKGSSGILFDTTIGGIWISSDTSIATVDSFAGTVTGVSVGTAIVTYAVGTTYEINYIRVNPSPSAIAGPSILCIGETATYHDTTAGGGNWNCINYFEFYIDASYSNYAILAGTHPGFDNLIFTDTSGCSTYLYIFVSPGPAAITGATNINVDSTTMLSSATPGGVWRSGDTTVATVASTGLVTGISPGTATILYSTDCSSSTIIHVLPPVSVPTQSGITEFGIYPNPAQTKFTITCLEKINDVTITNPLGQLVYCGKPFEEKALIDVSELPPGVYFVKVNSCPVKKIIKE